jgi:UDP-glucuronate 4-epimerase
MKHILITGVCGFIGFHLARRLLSEGRRVVGVDNLNPYYDVVLKESRLSLLEESGLEFIRGDLTRRDLVLDLIEKGGFETVVHLAAQAGVRHSLVDPYSYLESNLSGLFPLLEGCRNNPVRHLLFASSSSVYGGECRVPFSEHQPVDHPVSLYAATKRSGELLTHAYSLLYGIPTTALRFFTVYGPWGRPDMAYYCFTKLILEGRPIDVYNFGEMRRDFTYIDDIIDGVVRIMSRAPKPDPLWDGKSPDPASGRAPFRIYNIGRGKPVELMRFIEILESALGKRAAKNLLPMQKGDVVETFADIDDLKRDTGFEPKVTVEEGIERFVKWYREYHCV